MKNTFEEIVKRLHLGDSLLHFESLHGGALHSMWRVDTELGKFAIKEINTHISSRRAFPKPYETAEEIANNFYQCSLPAVCALKINDCYVNKILDRYFIVYPFINAHVMEADKLNHTQLQAVGDIFAKMHRLDLKIEGVDKPHYDIFENNHWTTLLTEIQPCAITPFLDQILKWNDKYHDAIPYLNSRLCITHRDMHPKNVLWDSKLQPHIVDWEAAGLMDPALEIIGYGLEWGGIISGAFIENNSKLILSTYKEKGGLSFDQNKIRHAFYGWLGHCVMGWTEFNLRRMAGRTSTDPNEMKIAKDIINENMKKCIDYIANHENELIGMVQVAFT